MRTQEHDDGGGDTAFFTQDEYEQIMRLRLRYLIDHAPPVEPDPISNREMNLLLALTFGLGFVSCAALLWILWNVATVFAR